MIAASLLLLLLLHVATHMSVAINKKSGQEDALTAVATGSANANRVHVELWTFETFPKNKVALHFACKESNVFSTNCACHLRCRTPDCAEAVSLCDAYSSTLGCQYVFIRGGKKNRIATLKRRPTEEEKRQFDVSAYEDSAFKTDAVNKKDMRKKADLADVLKAGGAYAAAAVAPFHAGAVVDAPKCGASPPSHASSADGWLQSFLGGSIGLAALSYQRPRTLLNSLRTWETSGLLDFMGDRLALLNDPLPAEVNMAWYYGLRVLQPKDIPMAKVNKPNVMTIGVAFYEALQALDTDYVLFLENDFKVDPDMSKEQLAGELLAAAGMLDRGAQIVRLQSRKGLGCGTFKACNHESVNRLNSKVPKTRVRNWMQFYCKPDVGSDKETQAKPYVSDCIPPGKAHVKPAKSSKIKSLEKGGLATPEHRCFTSEDSNWSLNAVMVKKSDMLSKKYIYGTGMHKQSSIPEIGLNHWMRQDAFESVMVHDIGWMRWKVPICISYHGIFLHEEIETSA